MLIYKATNQINNKVYIGQTQLSLEERKKSHYYDSKRLDTYFYRAINKYGWNNFIWEVIHDNIEDEDELDYWEQYYIKLYESFDNKEKGYNTQSGGAHFRITQEEAINRSNRVTGSNNPMYGKPGTWLGKTFSEEHKNKISQALKGKSKIYNIGANNHSARSIINLSTGEIFGCIKEACDQYGITSVGLRKSIKNNTHICNCQWDYLDNIDLNTFTPLEDENFKPNKRTKYYILELDLICNNITHTANAINYDNSLLGKKLKQQELYDADGYIMLKNYHIKPMS